MPDRARERGSEGECKKCARETPLTDIGTERESEREREEERRDCRGYRRTYIYV